MISKSAGGIGLHINNIRATGSYISGTNGYSNGIVPMLRVFNNVGRINFLHSCYLVPTLVSSSIDGAVCRSRR
jgi:hypothetical protein